MQKQKFPYPCERLFGKMFNVYTATIIYHYYGILYYDIFYITSMVEVKRNHRTSFSLNSSEMPYCTCVSTLSTAAAVYSVNAFVQSTMNNIVN